MGLKDLYKNWIGPAGIFFSGFFGTLAIAFVSAALLAPYSKANFSFGEIASYFVVSLFLTIIAFAAGACASKTKEFYKHMFEERKLFKAFALSLLLVGIAVGVSITLLAMPAMEAGFGIETGHIIFHRLLSIIILGVGLFSFVGMSINLALLRHIKKRQNKNNHRKKRKRR